MQSTTFIVSVFATASIGIAAAASANQDEASFEPFQRYAHRKALQAESQAIAIDEAVLASTRQRSSCTLTNVPLGLVGEVDLELHRTSIVAEDAQTLVVGKDGIERPVASSLATIWRGSVTGDESSDVFLSDSPAGLFGWIQTAGERYVITSGDPTGDRTTIIYPSMGLASAMIEWSPFECATINRNAPQMEEFGPHAPEEGGIAGNTCMTVEIAIDTDNAFLSMFGGDEAEAQGYIETLVAGANVIFSRDASAQLSIVYTRLWSSTDPWSATSTSGRLNEFRDYWRSQMSSVARDTAHHLSGQGLGGGVAWTIGAVCGTNSSYAVSANLNGFFPTPLQEHSSQNWDIVVFTHELGHLFDSPHTHSYNPPIDGCGTNCTSCNKCKTKLSIILIL